MTTKTHIILINWTTRQVAGVFLSKEQANEELYKKILAGEEEWILEEKVGYKKDK